MECQALVLDNYLGVFEEYSSTNLVTTMPMEAISLKLSDGG